MRCSPVVTTLLSGICLLTLASCSSETKTPKRSFPNIDVALESKLLTLEEKIDAVAATQARAEGADPEKVAKLEEDIRAMRELNQFLLREFVVPSEKTAILDPTSKGYSSANTEKGLFLFSIDDAAPFLDGHKIVLRIGNPMNMMFSGFTLNVQYNRRAPKLDSSVESRTSYDEWRKSTRKRTITFTDDLPPGTWTKVEVTLPETKPEDVTYLAVGIETNQISLFKPR